MRACDASSWHGAGGTERAAWSGRQGGCASKMTGPRWIASFRLRGVFAGPAGAAMLIVCFFLPWLRCSCGPGTGRTISGAGLGGIAWLVVFAGLAVLAAFALLWRRGQLHRAWPLPAAAALLASASIAGALTELSHAIHVGFTCLKPASIHLRVGGTGTIAGLVLLFLSTLLMLPRRRRARPGAARPAPPERPGAHKGEHLLLEDMYGD
jgi:hypothetical protein